MCAISRICAAGRAACSQSFVIDVFSRRVVGWQLASHMRTTLVLDALRMALGTRQPGADVQLIHHSDAGSQYTSADYQQELSDARVMASIGTVGDAYDNALAESFVDSFKTELIADRVWRTRSQLELAVVEYVAWFNTSRLHSALGYRPPAEVEADWHAQTDALTTTAEVYDPFRGRLRSTVLSRLTDNIKNLLTTVSAEPRAVQLSVTVARMSPTG